MIKQATVIKHGQLAVGYVRRSTDRQEQSIPDQQKAIQTYAAELGLKLSKFYVDDAISGTSTLGRKAFQQMIQDAEKPSKPFDMIIVYDVKRFGRIDNDEAGFYRHRLRNAGVDIHYVSENFNGDSTDDLLRPVKQWQARQESKDLSKVTIRGLLSKMPGGWWMGGTPPYGYDLRYQNAEGKFLLILRYMPDGSKQILDEEGKLTRTLARGESLNVSNRDRARLVPSEQQRVEVIKRIFSLYGEHGKGFKSLADALNQESIPTPRGPAWSHIYSGYWTDTTIRSILINPIYAGDMVWNRRTDGRFHRISQGRAVDREDMHGARLVPNDESDWLIVRDAHPALVSRRLFEMAKASRQNQPASIEQRGRNSRLERRRNWQGHRSRFILSGLMKCALCGNRYQGFTRAKGKLRIDGSRVKTFSYGCGGYITKGKKICQPNPIAQDALETLVIDAVLEFYKPCLMDNGRRKIADAVKQQIGCESQEFESARKRAQGEHDRVGGIINKLLDNITPTNREFVDQRLAELTEQRKLLSARLEELDRIVASRGEINTMVAEAAGFLSALEFTLRQGVPQEKLMAIRQCVERIWIDKPAGKAKLALRIVPVGNLGATTEVTLELADMKNTKNEGPEDFISKSL